MKVTLLRSLLIVSPLFALLAFAGQKLCQRQDLPPSIPATELTGSVGPLLRRIGPPDRRASVTIGKIYSEGLFGSPVPPGALDAAEGLDVEVLQWKRECFGCFGPKSRSLNLAVGGRRQQILFWTTPTTGWATPVLILGSEKSLRPDGRHTAPPID